MELHSYGRLYVGQLSHLGKNCTNFSCLIASLKHVEMLTSLLTSCGHQAPDDGHVLVPVWPQMCVVSSEDMEQLVEDEAGVAGGQPTQRRPQLQQDSLAPASVV